MLRFQACHAGTDACVEGSQTGWLTAINDAPSISVHTFHTLNPQAPPQVPVAQSAGLMPLVPNAHCVVSSSAAAAPGALMRFELFDPDWQDWQTAGTSGLMIRILLSSPGTELHFPQASQGLQSVIQQASKSLTTLQWTEQRNGASSGVTSEELMRQGPGAAGLPVCLPVTSSCMQP